MKFLAAFFRQNFSEIKTILEGGKGKTEKSFLLIKKIKMILRFGVYCSFSPRSTENAFLELLVKITKQPNEINQTGIIGN